MFSPIVKRLTYYITVRAFKKFTVRTNYSLSKKRLYRSNLYNRSMSLLFIHFWHLQTETSNLFTYLSSDIPYSSHPQDIHHSCNAYQIHHHASIDILPNDKKNITSLSAMIILCSVTCFLYSDYHVPLKMSKSLKRKLYLNSNPQKSNIPGIAFVFHINCFLFC